LEEDGKHHLVERLKRVLQASIETGNPVCWC
jgi:hypothetical protein